MFWWDTFDQCARGRKARTRCLRAKDAGLRELLELSSERGIGFDLRNHRLCTFLIGHPARRTTANVLNQRCLLGWGDHAGAGGQRRTGLARPSLPALL